jgi:hypothetical protein
MGGSIYAKWTDLAEKKTKRQWHVHTLLYWAEENRDQHSLIHAKKDLLTLHLTWS